MAIQKRVKQSPVSETTQLNTTKKSSGNIQRSRF